MLILWISFLISHPTSGWDWQVAHWMGFLFCTHCFHSISLWTCTAISILHKLWYGRSLPSLQGQSSSVSSACVLGCFCHVRTPPRLAPEKIGFSPARWCLAALPNNYLCFGNFFQLLKPSIQFDFFLNMYNICVFSSLLSFLPPIRPIPPFRFLTFHSFVQDET